MMSVATCIREVQTEPCYFGEPNKYCDGGMIYYFENFDNGKFVEWFKKIFSRSIIFSLDF